ncbi:MAG: LTA synthase family protein, partial [Arenimonas sp.]
MSSRDAGRLLTDRIPVESSEPGALAAAAARFFQLLPALLLALLCLRVAELTAGIESGATSSQLAALVMGAIGVDLVNLARYLPVLLLASLPFLLVRRPRGSVIGLGLAWCLLILVQAALVQYFLTARVPLGADLFAYSPKDIQKTIIGGLAFHLSVIVGLSLALIVFWAVLIRQGRRTPPQSRVPLAVIALTLVILAISPWRSAFIDFENEDARNLKLSKISYFLDDGFLYLTPTPAFLRATEAPAGGPGLDDSIAGFRYLDPTYPFLHAEQTPDVLGPHFSLRPGRPPNLVVIVAEGLGRSFSGPGARLGSFTPALDRLADHGLYWENFLAVQGRTFAVLPSLFGSLPFGENGFSRLAERMPAHHTLLSVLGQQGYELKFYCGFDSDFDNERTFLNRQGIDLLVDRFNFGKQYKMSNSWGFADGDLISRVLEGERHNTRQPFLAVIKTVTMHTPYRFAGQAGYNARFEQRLVELGVSERRKAAYRAHRDIYTSILYTDDALGRFFDEAKRLPGYENTVFVLVGDHRLPELPMATRIERYHVPLLIVSPLLKAPARIKSVSSHFDVTPSLLAFLSNNYNIKTPQAVAWIGSGLDTEPTFRNIHQFPLKQTKTNLVDFVSGTWFINQGQLYTLNDGMNIEPSEDATAMIQVQ